MALPVAPLAVRPAATLLKALSDENRLRMVALLAEGELCVCHLAGALELSQPNASQHLAVLKNAGLVEGERRGSWIYYRLAPTPDAATARLLRAVLDTCAELASTPDDQQALARVREDLPCP